MEDESIKINSYDRKDMVARDATLIAGPLKLAIYRVRDPETLEWSRPQVHMTYDNTVMAMLGENSAKLLAAFIADNLDAGLVRKSKNDT